MLNCNGVYIYPFIITVGQTGYVPDKYDTSTRMCPFLADMLGYVHLVSIRYKNKASPVHFAGMKLIVYNKSFYRHFNDIAHDMLILTFFLLILTILTK